MNQSVESPQSRRRFLGRLAPASLAALSAPNLSWAQDKAPAAAEKVRPADEMVTPAAEKAIEAGLRFLAGRQVQNGPDKGAFGSTGYEGSVGICGLAGLAFMSEGSSPGIGKFGKSVDGCADFLCRMTSPEGYISREGAGGIGNMYAHGFATLFLAMAYGMTRRREVGEKLRSAVKLTLSAQNDEGGWRYQPIPRDADLSVTVCQIMALRAARDAGINVPDKVREQCIQYVKDSQEANGAFRYTKRGGHTTFALTAAGVVSLFSAGIYEGDQVERGLKYIRENRDDVPDHYYFYGHYYAVQAMWHAGGKLWNDWYPWIRDNLLKMQDRAGVWSSPYGEEFGTAMACIILQMPKDRLPIFAK